MSVAAWSSGKLYRRGEVVTCNGALYQAATNIETDAYPPLPGSGWVTPDPITILATTLNTDGTLSAPSISTAVGTLSTGGGPHVHVEADVTALPADLAAKATNTHNHDASYAPTHAHPYAATSHAHVDGDLPAGLARDAEVAAAYAPIHAHPYEATGAVATHAGLSDPHPGYLTPAEGNAAYSVTSHTHAAGETIPAGVIVMWGGLLANIPSGWALCDGQSGRPDLRDRFIKGAANAANPGTTGGAATHTHAAHSDHAALAHSGATVGAHAFTQPGAHTDHAALTHSAHAGATVADHAAHTHTFTQSANAATPDLLTLNTATAGVAASGTTGNPNATLTHTVGQASAHSDHAALAHSAHSGGAVDAHTVGQASNHAAQSHSGHDSPNSEPAYYALAFIQKT